MRLSSLSAQDLHRALEHPGLYVQIGPFCFNLRSKLSALAKHLPDLYGLYTVFDEIQFADFHIRLYSPNHLRRWLKPQVQFSVDDHTPFEPFPADTALPFLEWGMNWCVAMRAHQYLMLHAGAVEKNGHVLLLPASPGSGKSTLSVALNQRGWRLFSDEFALVKPYENTIVPFPRLIPLKNDSIPVIREFAPDVRIGPTFPKTRKGDVAHVQPTQDSIERSDETAQARWIIFPQYAAHAELTLKPLAKERAFLKLTANSFNYELLGLCGFETFGTLIDACDCYLFQYSDLDQAIACMDELAAQAASKSDDPGTYSSLSTE